MTTATAAPPRQKESYSVHDHPLVQSARHQRERLEQAVAVAQEQRRQLTVKRNDVKVAAKNRTVAALLDGQAPAGAQALDQDLAAIDGELAQLTTHHALLNQQCAAQVAAERAAVTEAKRELRERITAEGRGILARQARAITEIEREQARLVELQRLGLMRFPETCFLLAELFKKWRLGAQRFGADV